MLILSSAITHCLSISSFFSLVCVPVGIASSSKRIKVCEITAGIKKYKPVKRKRRKNKIEQYCFKLNTIEVIISNALIDSYVSHDKFVSINNVLKEDYQWKKK